MTGQVHDRRLLAASGSDNDPWLEWLRGGAALLVFFSHLRALYFVAWSDLDAVSRNPLNAVLFELSRLGREAVMVFFVLSGFLVGGRALRDLVERRFDARRYATDRASRLYVVLIPALFLTAACDVARGGWSSTDNGLEVFLANLFFLQDVTTSVYGSNGPLWSLAYEAWYYVLFGIGVQVVSDFRDGRRRRALVLGAALLILLSWLFTRNPRIAILFPLWLGGAALAWQASYGRWPIGARWALWIVLPGALVGSSMRGDVTGDLAVGVAALLAIGGLYRWDTLPSWAARIGRRLASMSYSLYAIHYPMVALVISAVTPQRISHAGIVEWGGLVAIAISLWLVAAAFYIVFERQTQRVRQALRRRISRSPATLDAGLEIRQ